MAEEYTEGQTAGGGRFRFTGGQWHDLGASAAGAGAAPKGPVTSVTPPEDYSPTWGEAGEDVKRSIVPGLEKGALAIPTAPATIGGLLAKGVGKIGDVLPDSKFADKLSSGSQKVQDWLKPWDFQTNQNKFEESYNRFKPPDKQFYHPKYTSGSVAEQLASFAPGMVAGGGGGLAARAMTTGASALGAQAGGGIVGSLAGEEYAPYGELIGALRGGRAANLPRRMITPNPMTAAERAAGDLVRSKVGPNALSAGQYTQSPKLLQREGNMLDYAPDTFKSMMAGQPEAMSHALLKETGATPPTSGPTVARAVLKGAKGDIEKNVDTLKALNVDAHGIAHPTVPPTTFDPEFYAKQASIQKELYGSKKPDLAKPNALDSKLQEIFNDTSNITHDSTTANRGGLNSESYYNIRTDIGGEIGKLYKAGKIREAEAMGKLRTALDEHMDRSLKGTPFEGKWREVLDQQAAHKAIKKSIEDSHDPTAPVEASKVFGAAGTDTPIGKLSSAITQTAKPLPEPKTGIDMGPVLGAAVGAGMGHLTGAGGLEAGVLGTLHGPLVNSLLKGPRATMAKILLSPTGQKWLSNTVLGPGTHMDPKTARRLLAVQGTQTPYKLDKADDQGN